MIKFSRGALNRPRHDTPFCNSLCNLCEASTTWVNPGCLRKGVTAGCADSARRVSAYGAYVEADIGIDQRFLRCCDAIGAQGGVEWRTSFDQP
jgi:hypothetical protein